MVEVEASVGDVFLQLGTSCGLVEVVAGIAEEMRTLLLLLLAVGGVSQPDVVAVAEVSGEDTLGALAGSMLVPCPF